MATCTCIVAWFVLIIIILLSADMECFNLYSLTFQSFLAFSSLKTLQTDRHTEREGRDEVRPSTSGKRKRTGRDQGQASTGKKKQITHTTCTYTQ